MHDVAFALWFLLPAGLANVAPIFAAHTPGLRRLDWPMDGGRQWHGQPLLGSHKTWRGLIVGLGLAILTVWLQQWLAANYTWADSVSAPVNYPALPTVLTGLLLGFGALGGDAIKSFFKRRLGTVAGGTWIPFDQIDYVVGALLLSLFVIRLPWHLYLWIVVLWVGVHLAASYVGWQLGLKDAPI